MDRRPIRPALLVFVTTLPLLAAIAFLPGEFTHYKRWLELEPNGTGLRLVVLGAILAKTIAAFGIAFLILLPCARFVAPRILRLLSLVLGLVVLGFIGVDLELQKNTGNHVGDYLAFLLDPEAFVWAGPGFDAAPGLLRVARNLFVALVPAAAIAWLLERRVERSTPRRGWIVLSVVLCFVPVVLIAAPALQRTFGAPGPLHHLNERLPWTWLGGIGVESSSLDEAQRAAQAVFEGSLSDLVESPRRPSRRLRERPARRPDILVVVVESLRADALTPKTMPRLWSWSKRGLRRQDHSATSNASHYGLFALLYGRSPLFYFETLDSGERPTLPAQLREWGYENHYLTCTDIAWREMERFLGPSEFAVERLRGESLPACDREVVARAADLLSAANRSPRFVLTFLISTHFGYHYPDGEEPFEPSMAPPNALELDAARDRIGLINRYRNSAHAIDALIGSLLDRVDSQETLVVVTGDHGESLFDDGTIAHSSLLSEVQTRVPFVLTGPGVMASDGRRGPSDHVDLLPTLLARLGVEPEILRGYEGSDLQDGAALSFVPLVAAKARRSHVDRVVLVGGRNRYAFRLDTGRGEARFLGKLTQDGRPSDEPVSEAEGVDAVRWLSRFLDQRTP